MAFNVKFDLYFQRSMSSRHLGLRRAAVSCLRQLAQREAREVCEHARACAVESAVPLMNGSSQNGLPAALFLLLDTEADETLQRHIRDTITGLLTSLAEQQLSAWLTLCKEVLTTSADTTSTVQQHVKVSGTSKTVNDADGAADDDEEEFHASAEEMSSTAQSWRPADLPPPRWPTRVFAAQCAAKLIALARESNKAAHFNLSTARELRTAASVNGHSSADYLVLHLPDMIRLAFIAATSDCDPLRMEGLNLLQLLIDCFAAQQEPGFPGHSILEQYQAQVSAALRPAFSADTAPNVTAAACHVSSTWMSCGVVKDYDLIPKDVQQKIHDFAKEEFIPALLDYIEKKNLPIDKISFSNFHLIAERGDILETIFNDEQRYDLWKLSYLKRMPITYYSKLEGKRLIGSAIRICEAIGRPECADAFNKIVEGCFTPHKTQDETDDSRRLFGLTVKP